MATDSFCFNLQNRLIQTSQTGGQRYSDTSPFSIPWGYTGLHLVQYLLDEKSLHLGRRSRDKTYARNGSVRSSENVALLAPIFGVRQTLEVQRRRHLAAAAQANRCLDRRLMLANETAGQCRLFIRADSVPADETSYYGLIGTELLFLYYKTFFLIDALIKKARAFFNQSLLLTNETV